MTLKYHSDLPGKPWRVHPLGSLVEAAIGLGVALLPDRVRKPVTIPSKRDELPAAWDTYQVGSFLLYLASRDERVPSLRVTHRSEPVRVLWESIPGESFLLAARGHAHIRENVAPFSGFVIRDRILALCDQQSVERVEPGDASLTLRGTLSGRKGTVDYTLTFRAVGEHQLQFQALLQGPQAASFNRLFLRSASSREEQFFGFGQQFTLINQRVKRFPSSCKSMASAAACPSSRTC